MMKNYKEQVYEFSFWLIWVCSVKNISLTLAQYLNNVFSISGLDIFIFN